MIPIEELSALAPERLSGLLNRGRGRLADLAAPVDAIIARVRAEGDAALLEYTRRFDGVSLDAITVPREDIAQALADADPAYLAALRRAAQSITTFHETHLREREERGVETAPGVAVWRVWRPIEHIGVYVPGGSALYPSSLLMAAIPARIAGCRTISVCTPPGPDGRVPAALLVAAALVGVDDVYALGGAQAIAALAYGTASVRRVDKIVGPGSSYVAAAKIRVAADVAIDMPAGPSEILIVADETADPAFVASDLLAQAEHGPESAAILVTSSATVAARVQAELSAQITDLPTAATIRQSLERNGALLVAASLAEAIAFANNYATEHLEIITHDPNVALPQIQHAGSVFLGNYAPVAAGDYATGSNHTLPTARFARSFPPLATETFGRWMQVQSLTAAGLAELRPTIETLATTEGLPGHAASIRARFGDDAELANFAETSSYAATGHPQGAPLQGSPSPSQMERGLGGEAAPLGSEPQRAEQPNSFASSEGEATPLIRLNANENPYGPSPRTRALLEHGLPAVYRYPDHHQARLRAALAREVGVTPEQIVVGNGSDEILHFISLATLTAGDEVLICEPTFGVYRAEAERRGATVIDVPLRDDFSLDGAALLHAITPRTKLIWLCSPNNPTGTAIDLTVLPELLERGPLVVVDEAYRQPDSPSVVPLLPTSPRLIVTQTLSKVAGLAGLRLGYAICAPAIVALLDAQRLPYNVNVVAEATALATLEDSAWVVATWHRVLEEREKLAARLLLFHDVRAWPSAANFLLVELPGRDAQPVCAALAARGVLVRDFTAPRLQRCFRVTIGLPQENDAFIAALAGVLATQATEVMA